MANIKKMMMAAAGAGGGDLDMTLAGQLWTSGNDIYGLQGLGTLNTNKNSPVRIGSKTNWKTIASGGFGHTAVIDADGKLFTWGYNINGGLGHGDSGSPSNDRSVPTQVGGDTNWLDVAHGFKHTIAVRTDGSLWAWGGNQGGYLGTNNTTNYSSPVRVGSLNDWVNVSSTMRHSASIKADGSLWTWGGGFSIGYGVLGLNDTTNRSSPTRVGGLNDWAQVHAGAYTTAAVKTDGTLWVWGSGNQGRQGTNNTTIYSSPVKVGVDEDWQSVNVGRVQMVMIKTDGTLWTTGRNAEGALGLGDTTNRSVPTKVGSSDSWARAEMGNNWCVAIQNDGTAWSWGFNGWGNLGLGNTTNRSVPVQIGTDTDWIDVFSHAKDVLRMKKQS